MGLNLNEKKLITAINCQVIPVASYVMNVYNLGKCDLEELGMALKSVLRREVFHERPSSDDILYPKRNEGGRGLKSFKEVYNETKTRVAYCMTATTKEWIRVAWRNESQKEQISLKKEAEKVMRKGEMTVSFDEGSVITLNGKDNGKTEKDPD